MTFAIGRGFACPGGRSGAAIGDRFTRRGCHGPRTLDLGLQRVGIRQRGKPTLCHVDRFLGRFCQRGEIGSAFFQPAALRIQPLQRRGRRIPGARRIAARPLGGGRCRSRRLAFTPVCFDGRRRAVAGSLRLGDSLFQSRQLPVDFGQPVSAKQSLCGRGAAANADKPVPPPHDSVAGHEPLSNCEPLAAVLVGNSNLRKPPMQRGRRVDMVEQPVKPRSQRRIARFSLAALPAPRPFGPKARVDILAKRGRQRALIAGRRLQLGKRSAAAMAERPGQRVMFRLGRAKRGAGRGQRAFGFVTGGGGVGPLLLRLGQRRLGGRQLAAGFFGRLARIFDGFSFRSAIADRRELLGQPLAFRSDPLRLRVGDFQRRLGDPSLGAHRRFAGQHSCERGLSLARHRLGFCQFRGDSGGDGLAVRKPLLDRTAFLVERLYGPCRVSLERNFTGCFRR